MIVALPVVVLGLAGLVAGAAVGGVAEPRRLGEEAAGDEVTRHPRPSTANTVISSAVKRSIGFTITEKNPTRAFSWLKVPTSADAIIRRDGWAIRRLYAN